MDKIKHFEDVRREIDLDVVALMPDGIDSTFHADDILPVMATPCTRIDFSRADAEHWPLTILMRSVRRFMKGWRHVEAYDKNALTHFLATNWLPKLGNAVKYAMLKEDKLIGGVSADGIVTINEAVFNGCKKLLEKGNYHRFVYTYDTDYAKSSGMSHFNQENARVFQLETVDGYDEVDLPITEKDWYTIIKSAPDKAKEYLACLVNMPTKRYSCYDVESLFDFKTKANTWNNVIGRRAKFTMNIDVQQMDNGVLKHRIWCFPMNKGQWDKKRKVFMWEARPEMLAAARKVLEEEHFPLPHPKSK